MTPHGKPPAPGPVAAAHRLFIATALGCALVYALWELREYLRTNDRESLLVAGLAALASVAIAVYLRSLRGLGRKLTPRDGA